MEDKYLWRAKYNDGVTVNQRDGDGTAHAYEDLDRSKLSSFCLIDRETGDTAYQVSFSNEEEANAFRWTRRTRTHDFESFVHIHIIAIEDRFVSALFPDGSVITQTRYANEETSLFAKVVQ